MHTTVATSYDSTGVRGTWNYCSTFYLYRYPNSQFFSTGTAVLYSSTMCSSPGSVPVPSGRLTPETVCLPPWSLPYFSVFCTPQMFINFWKRVQESEENWITDRRIPVIAVATNGHNRPFSCAPVASNVKVDGSQHLSTDIRAVEKQPILSECCLTMTDSVNVRSRQRKAM